MKALLDNLKTKFGRDPATRIDTARRNLCLRTPRLLEIARHLHDAPEAAFDHLTDICSVDYPEDQQRFEIVPLALAPFQQRSSQGAPHGERPTIASLRSVEGASLEREVYDMMGIHFSGHPILGAFCCRSYGGGPLRKIRLKDVLAQPVRLHRIDEPSIDVIESEISDAERSLAPTSRTRFPTEEKLLLFMARHQTPMACCMSCAGRRTVVKAHGPRLPHRGVENCRGLTCGYYTRTGSTMSGASSNYAYVRAEKLLEIEV